MSSKLVSQLVLTIMSTAPEKYDRIMSEAVRPRIKQSAYQLLRALALAA